MEATIVLTALLACIAVFQALLWRRARPPAPDFTPLLSRLEGIERGEERMERGLGDVEALPAPEGEAAEPAGGWKRVSRRGRWGMNVPGKLATCRVSYAS